MFSNPKPEPESFIISKIIANIIPRVGHALSSITFLQLTKNTQNQNRHRLHIYSYGCLFCARCVVLVNHQLGFTSLSDQMFPQAHDQWVGENRDGEYPSKTGDTYPWVGYKRKGGTLAPNKDSRNRENDGACRWGEEEMPERRVILAWFCLYFNHREIAMNMRCERSV